MRRPSPALTVSGHTLVTMPSPGDRLHCIDEGATAALEVE